MTQVRADPKTISPFPGENTLQKNAGSFIPNRIINLMKNNGVILNHFTLEGCSSP